MLKLAHPTIYHRGARSGDNPPGRCAISTSAWRTKPIDARKSPSRGSRSSTTPASSMKPTASVASRCPPGIVGSATARPIGIPAVAARSIAAHCATRSSPTSRSGCVLSMRLTRHASTPNADADSATAVSITRPVSVMVSHYTCPRMRAVDLIRHKRDGGALADADVRAFVAGVTDSSWPDYQVAALLMAIVWRGMTLEEASALTDAMVRSGQRLDLSEFGGTPVDKHSTGGVGDKTSLILAPLAVACGAVVPMMSGRGLGHTGGTLDKLEAIPGFRTRLSLEEMRRVLRDTHCVMIGQTDEIAPADRRLYALRDVTGTVESIPLICASILSKKIAEGIGALVLDVKVGRGAFMKTEADARTLAEWLCGIAERNGVRTEALLTSMDEPLGRAVGNANEVIE